jgi:hypothetical protein
MVSILQSQTVMITVSLSKVSHSPIYLSTTSSFPEVLVAIVLDERSGERSPSLHASIR